jgi:hypothetical protein
MNTQIDKELMVIFGRRSIRVYSPGAVDEAIVQKLLAAAMAAPSASGKNPWHFVVVRNRPTLSRMSEVLPYGQPLATAALGIVVCGDLEVAHDHQLSYLLQDCSAAIENLLLCAHILGLGACWLAVHHGRTNQKYQRDFLTTSLSHPGGVYFSRSSWRVEGTTRRLQSKLRAFGNLVRWRGEKPH